MSVIHINDTVSGPGYDIYTERDFSRLSQCLDDLKVSDRRVLIVTDSNVEGLYLSEVREKALASFKEVYTATLPAGEENKNLDNVRILLNILIEKKLDRNDYLIALGGGVIGDMAGFASAVYLRGIRFIQIPTTLLSQTDSSIGGKTGVDLKEYKNMVGAFHQPALVYINISVLDSLPPRQFASGMAEILKHGLIRDSAYYEWLITHFEEIKDKDPGYLLKMIDRSCEIKAAVVEEDPDEKGLRAILNFGHTIGHAIEKYYDFKLLHGECVALGMIAASYITYCRGNIEKEEYLEIRDMFLPFGLPLTLPDKADADEIIKLTRSDKKMDKGRIKFIILKRIGEALITTDVSDEEIKNGIGEIV